MRFSSEIEPLFSWITGQILCLGNACTGGARLGIWMVKGTWRDINSAKVFEIRLRNLNLNFKLNLKATNRLVAASGTC